MSQGRYQEAIEACREGLRLNPNDAPGHSNLLLLLHYPESQPAAALKAAHDEWASRHGNSGRPPSSWPNPSDPDRCLRVGYVSPDLRNHPVASFFEPLLFGHDRNAVQVYCYALSQHADDTTRRLQSLSDGWRAVFGQPDEAIERLVRADRIDVLVDLAGHTSQNRLTLFARKPAPVQVTYLGYPDTTGLPQVDGRITDPWVDPPGSDVFYAERLLRLPRCFLCYQPPPEAPAVAPLPASRAAGITFGSFNNLAKINPGVVSLWCELLRAVPSTRLLVKNPSLTDPPTRERYLGMFEERGVPLDRLGLLGKVPATADHLATYGRVDIALDTFPYNGTTTTCEALWMGVPVITLRGDTHAGRVGDSLLHAVGCPEWVATSPEHYLDLARSLAGDLGALAATRLSLRERVARSTLRDAPSVARAVEEAYRGLWRAWCAARTA